jgi:hypothetical protein
MEERFQQATPVTRHELEAAVAGSLLQQPPPHSDFTLLPNHLIQQRQPAQILPPQNRQEAIS